MNRYLCIVAGQRAGTTALHSALASTGKFENFKEVFHTDPGESAGTFLKFCKDRAVSVADMATEAQAQMIANDYLCFLQDMSGGRVPILDIKLNSWHVVKPFWSYVHETPFFMRVLLRENAVFLLIRRRGLVDQVISEQIARHFDKWHNLEECDVGKPIVINVMEVAEQAQLVLQGESFLSGCLKGKRGFIAIDYEDLFPDGFVNPRLLQLLQSRLAVDLPEVLQPTIKRNTPDKRKVIANFDEVSRAIELVVAKFPRPTLPSL